MRNSLNKIAILLSVSILIIFQLLPVYAQDQASETKNLLTAQFYENTTQQIAGTNNCLGIGLPNINDTQKAADAINKYIEEFEQRTGKSSPFHGLGSSFITGAQSGGINPFLAVAHLYHESGFATAPEGWHTTEPPSYNAFGRSAVPTQPHTTYTTGTGRVRLVYKWNSWQDSLDGSENWFKYVRDVYLGTYKISPNDLPAFIARYAPKSDGNNEEAYVKILQDTMQKLVEYSDGGISCADGATGGSQANIQLGQTLAAQAGWIGNEWTCLVNLWTKESGWNELADNPKSTAFGIPQAMLSVHYKDIDANYPGFYEGSRDKPTGGKAEPQIRWGLKYIRDRYTTPCRAWEHWQSEGNY